MVKEAPWTDNGLLLEGEESYAKLLSRRLIGTGTLRLLSDVVVAYPTISVV